MTGFTITPDWITLAEEEQLVGRIRTRLNEATEKDSRGGRSAILRFGWDYNDENVWVRDIPAWLNNGKLHDNVFDSVTVNLYNEGAAIAPHIDSLKFGAPIRILSLLSDAEMIFKPKCGVCSPIKHKIAARSLARLDGESRYEYQHSLAPVKAERISVVFRNRLLDAKGIGKWIAVKQDIYEDG